MSSSQGFTAVFCSSEDPAYPFENLFKDEVPAGWTSLPNPSFPIETIVDMKGNFVLNGLDIVSHEFMIANRIDLFGSLDEKLDKKTQWFEIGFFSFNTNQRSQWIARELKHVSTENVTVRYLRILIEGVHDVPPNRDNRCAIISLTFNGHKEIKPRMTGLNELIEDLTKAKVAAVQDENYAEAAQYKDQLLNIEENKAELENLFAKRVEFLKQEEYLEVESVMKQINSIIKANRDEIEEIQQIPQHPIKFEEPLPEVHEPEPEPEPQPSVSQPSEQPEPQDSLIQVNEDPGFFLTGFDRNTTIAIAPEEPVPAEEEPAPIPEPEPVNHEPEPEPEPDPTPRRRQLDAESSPRRIAPPKERVPRFSKPPQDSPPKVETPDELSDENKAEASTLINLFGERPVALAYSQNWSLRVQGLERLCELIKGLKTKAEQTRALSGILPLMRRRFQDGLKATYCAAVEQMMNILDSLKVEGAELGSAVHVLFPIALAKVGDTNARIDEVSNNFVLWCADKDKWAREELQQYCVKAPPVNQYHLQKAKLNLVEKVVEKYGVGDKGKVKLSEVMGLVVPCLDSRKEDVRKMAIKLTISLQQKFGTAVEKYMKNVPRLVKDQLAQATQANN